MRDYKCNCRKLMLTLCCSISEKVTLQHPCGIKHHCPNACPLLCWGERSCNKLIKARCFPFSQGKGGRVVDSCAGWRRTLSSSISCSLEWGKKKFKYPRTKIEFKKIKTPLSTVVVARKFTHYVLFHKKASSKRTCASFVLKGR